MNKTLAISLIAGTFLLSGCGSPVKAPAVPVTIPSPAPATTSAQTTPTSQTTPVETAQSSAISIRNFAFNPDTITVKKGATVTWTNNDSAPHQIKSDTFNSGALGNGQSFSYAFENAGTFDYSCAIHPSMTGTITVN